MFPLKDTIRSRSFPLVTWLIIIANVLVFFFELSLSQQELSRLISTFGLTADHIDPANPLTWFPLFSHMFLHGGWVHIISNQWTLFIFGDNVEDRMGSFRFLIFYLVGGVGAGILQILLGTSNVPSIGASGAIAAVLGAYFILFPHSKVITFIPLFFCPGSLTSRLWFTLASGSSRNSSLGCFLSALQPVNPASLGGRMSVGF